MKAIQYTFNTFKTRDEARTFLIDNGFTPAPEPAEYGRWKREYDGEIERVEAYKNIAGQWLVNRVYPRNIAMYIVE